METPETEAERAALVTARDNAWVAYWKSPERGPNTAAFQPYLAAINALVEFDRAHPAPLAASSPAAAMFEAFGTIERLLSQMPEPTQVRPDDAD